MTVLSQVYQAARAALSLQEPSWTTDGEILNGDRMAHYRGNRSDEGVKFTTTGDADLFHKFDRLLGPGDRPSPGVAGIGRWNH